MGSVCCFVFYRGEILLILRDKNKKTVYPGTWGIVGGGIEKKESKLMAMRRESSEEIGIVPKKLLYLGKNKAKKHVFFARITQPEFKRIKLGKEGQLLKFSPVRNLKKLKMTPQMELWRETSFEAFTYMSRVRTMNPSRLRSFLGLEV